MTPTDETTPQDSEQDDIARRPRMPDQQKEPVEWLIYRLMYLNEEKLQDGPVDMVSRAAALAQLYQAKFLSDIAAELTELRQTVRVVRRNPRHFVRRNPRKSFADIFRDLADAAEDLEDR